MITYSIIQKSNLKDNHRIDAEYFQPEYLYAEQKLASIKTFTIDDISQSVINFGAYSLCTNQFISKASLWYNRRHERN